MLFGRERYYAATMPSSRALPRPGVAARVWGPTWRMGFVIIMGFIAFSVFWGVTGEELEQSGDSLDSHAGLLVLDLLLGLTAMALYPLRRRWPLPIVGVIIALSAFSVAAVPAAILAIVSLATRRQAVEIAIISILLLSSLYVNSLIQPVDTADPWWLLPLSAVLVMAIPTLLGMYVGARRQSRQVLEERAEQVLREQDSRLEAARLSERHRIARDMHDALAHRLSLLSLHAGVLEYRTDLSPEEARVTAGVVRENARLASSDLRDVLGVLRDPKVDHESTMVRPDPSVFDAITLLLQEGCAAGNPSTLSMNGTTTAHLDTLPVSVRQHVSRVIQEGLTNARKHAPGGPVEVRIEGAPGQRISLELTNPLGKRNDATGAPPSGFGLMGLRERARIADGEVRTHLTDTTFRLEAWFPWKT